MLVFGWFSSEEGNFRVGSDSPQKHLDGFQNVGKPVFETIAESKDVDAPSNHIFVLNSVHILPGKFQMLAERETVQVDLGGSSQHVSLRAESFATALGPHLDCDLVDVVEFLVFERY